MAKIRCIFMGTPQIAADVLNAMLDADIDVELVVTQPDKKVGRKQKIVYSPVKQVAQAYAIPCFQPIRIKTDYQTIIDTKPDVIVTCAYGQIVPQEVLDAPVYGCVNLHGSLLPKYRGGAPIQRAIWNGDQKSGMSLMKMVPAMDAGPVMDTEEIEITPDDTASTLFEKMGQAAGRLIVKDFDRVCSPDAVYTEQDESQVVYAPIIKKEEEHLDLSQPDERILCQIRALADHPGAYVKVGRRKLKILKADYKKEEHAELGTIFGNKKQFGIALHEGNLYVERCQMEGKPLMDSQSFCCGQGRNLVDQKAE
ncbi:methionyl-tRNA formyltransferase [Catenisphaera adipataccumulans]|jgi:methionyl-tRNA formyltransferase|uniref:Methionyl-tRNA formyltransferase n=1 Tax=Catenisphaera adipataccumulans TaxID=700500 RepID=A0A7W8CX34_9FIRM|nr:methionyl-tRNA formyltransferase [Catenisphaera adipataccumulans]MBB5183178.1 methionyl-tRNA formyltransferase [Catenisphaera adipataccumulans]